MFNNAYKISGLVKIDGLCYKAVKLYGIPKLNTLVLYMDSSYWFIESINNDFITIKNGINSILVQNPYESLKLLIPSINFENLN